MVIMIKVWQRMAGNWAWRGEGRGGLQHCSFINGEGKEREKSNNKKTTLPKGGNMPKGGNRYSTGKGKGTLFRHRDKRGRERRGPGGWVGGEEEEAASGSITDQ